MIFGNSDKKSVYIQKYVLVFEQNLLDVKTNLEKLIFIYLFLLLLSFVFCCVCV